MSSAHSRIGIGLILALALALRVGTAIGLQSWLDTRPDRTFLIEGDANGYWHLAQDIAEGRDYAVYTPPRRVLRMPGFPMLLAIPHVLFDQPILPARILLSGIGAVACGLVYVLGRRLFDAHVGLIAAGLSAVSPLLVGFSPVILSETAFAACLMASLIGMAWLVDRNGWRQRMSDSDSESASSELASPEPTSSFAIAALVGVLIAAACYFRPSWLLAGPAFGLGCSIAASKKPRGVLMGLCMMVGIMGSLLPWGLRNQQVSGHFTFTSFWMGPSLYDGLNPEATGGSDMTFYDRDNLMGQGMSEYDVDQHYRRAAEEFAIENPGRTIQLGFIKLGRYFNPWPNAPQFDDWRLKLLIGPFFVVVMLLAIRGCWVTRHDRWAIALTLGPLLYFAALHMLFVSSLRYRLPAEYPLMILVAVGWRSLRTPTSPPSAPVGRG